MTQTLFWIFLLLLPFQFALNLFEGVDFASGRLLALLLILFIFARALKTRSFFISFTPLSLFLLLFLLWSGASLLWAEDTSAGTRKFLFLLNFFPLFWLVPNLAKFTKSDFVRLEKVILYPALIVSVIGITQFATQFIVGVDAVFQFWASLAPFIYGDTFSQSILAHSSWLVEISGATLFRALAFFPDPHIFGFYLAFVTPLAFFSKRTLFKIFGIIFISALLLTFSRAAYVGVLGAFVSFPLIALSAKRKAQNVKLQRKAQSFKLLVVVLTFALFALSLFLSPIRSRFLSSFNITEGSIAGRLENWSQALSLIRENPALGVGLGNYARALDPLAGERSPVTAHNLYLDIWAELGIVGLALFLGIAFLALKKSFHSSPPIFLTFVWFFTQAMFDTPLFSVHILPLLIIFLSFTDTRYSIQDTRYKK